MIFKKRASILPQRHKGVGGWEEGRVERKEGEKPPQVKTRGPELPFRSRVKFKGNNTQLAHPTGANMSFMFYKVVNPPFKGAHGFLKPFKHTICGCYTNRIQLLVIVRIL